MGGRLGWSSGLSAMGVPNVLTLRNPFTNSLHLWTPFRVPPPYPLQWYLMSPCWSRTNHWARTSSLLLPGGTSVSKLSLPDLHCIPLHGKVQLIRNGPSKLVVKRKYPRKLLHTSVWITVLHKGVRCHRDVLFLESIAWCNSHRWILWRIPKWEFFSHLSDFMYSFNKHFKSPFPVSETVLGAGVINIIKKLLSV